MTRVYQICKFQDSWSTGSCANISSLHLLLWGMDKTNWVCRNDDQEGFSKIVNLAWVGLKLCKILITDINMQHIDCSCISGLQCSFPLPLLSFLYSMMCRLMCESFWQEVSVKSLIFRWPLMPIWFCCFTFFKRNKHNTIISWDVSWPR